MTDLPVGEYEVVPADSARDWILGHLGATELAAIESPNDWCGHCGRPLEDGIVCPAHGVPDYTVDEEEAWRLRDEEKHDFKD